MNNIHMDINGSRVSILVLQDEDFNRHARETGKFTPEGIRGSSEYFRSASIVIHRGKILKNRYENLNVTAEQFDPSHNALVDIHSGHFTEEPLCGKKDEPTVMDIYRVTCMKCLEKLSTKGAEGFREMVQERMDELTKPGVVAAG